MRSRSLRLLERKFSRRLQTIAKSARVRLEVLDAATSLQDLNLPGFRLEVLKGDRKGQFSENQNGFGRFTPARCSKKC